MNRLRLVWVIFSEWVLRRHYGFRPQPEHVKQQPYPTLPEMRLLRGGMAFLMLTTLLSIVPTTQLAQNLAHSPDAFPAPFLFVYTWIDGTMQIATHLNASGSLGNPFNFSMGAASSAVTPPPPETPAWVGAYVVALVLCALFGLFAAIGAAFIPSRLPRSMRGRVRHDPWASLNDLVQAKLLDHNQPGIVVGAVTMPRLFGIIPMKPRLLVDANPAHVLMKASSRSGKDVGPIAATMTTYPYSIIIADNKNEQYLLTSGVSRDYYEKDVYRLCLQAGKIGDRITKPDGTTFEEQFGCSTHNLFSEIPWGTDREYAAVLQMMTVMVAKEMRMLDDGENGHWYRTSRVLGTALAYKVEYDPEEPLKSPSRVAMLLAGDAAQNEESRDLKAKLATDGAEVDSIHDIIEHYLGFSATGRGSDPAWITRALENLKNQMSARLANARTRIGLTMSEREYGDLERKERGKCAADSARIKAAMVHPDMERAIRNTMRIRGEEAGSVYSTINGVMTPWLDPRVIENTRTSAFTMLGVNNSDRPAVLHLVNSPDYGDMFSPIYRVFLDLMLRLQVPVMDQDLETKRMISPHKWPTVWIINEPRTLGEIPALVPILPFAASYGHRFFFAYQLANQLEAQFDKDEPISGNSFTSIWHTPNDPKEQQDISEMLGERMNVSLDETRTAFGQPSRTLRFETLKNMTPQEVGMIPNDPEFVMRWDPETFEKVPKKDADGRLTVTNQAGQILTTRRGFAWSRKIQWFVNEFAFGKLIFRYPAVPPSRTMVDIKGAVAESPPPDVTPPTTDPVLERPLPTIELQPLRSKRRIKVASDYHTPGRNVTTGTVPPSSAPATIAPIPPAFEAILDE